MQIFMNSRWHYSKLGELGENTANVLNYCPTKDFLLFSCKNEGITYLYFDSDNFSWFIWNFHLLYCLFQPSRITKSTRIQSYRRSRLRLFYRQWYKQIISLFNHPSRIYLYILISWLIVSIEKKYLKWEWFRWFFWRCQSQCFKTKFFFGIHTF